MQITPEIEAAAGDTGSDLSRGGMVTKIEAAKIATSAGAAMVIASGHRDHPIAAIGKGQIATWFRPSTNPVTARKRWIAGTLEPRGAVAIDAGAVKALCAGKSLLPAGVVTATGAFSRGDAVRVTGPDGREIARGLSAYDVTDTQKLAGRRSAEIEDLLGYRGRSELIHRDDLVLRDGIALD